VINYIQGDIFKHTPIDGKLVIMPHVVNNLGGWGAGFTRALSKHHPIAEQTYREWFAGTLGEDESEFALGRTHVTYCTAQLHVLHMACQESYKAAYNRRPLNYEYLYQCMEGVRKWCLEMRGNLMSRSAPETRDIAKQIVEIHAPKFGSDLAGGNWKIIESMIEVLWVESKIPVSIYYL